MASQDTTAGGDVKSCVGAFVPVNNVDNLCGIVSLKNISTMFDSLNARCTATTKDGMHCGGRYRVTSRISGWTGGELSFKVCCDRCGKHVICGNGARSLRDRQSPLSTLRLGHTMMMNFILTGGSRFQRYERWMIHQGMEPLGKYSFDKAIEQACEAVQQTLKEEMLATKEWLKQLPGDKWKRGVMALDGSWCTPGASAPHGSFVARSVVAFGAILGFRYMSRNDGDRPFLGTSASMEVFGCVEVLNNLYQQASRVCV